MIIDLLRMPYISRFDQEMGFLAEASLIPSISYTELLHDDTDTRGQAAINLAQALKAYGALVELEIIISHRRS